MRMMLVPALIYVSSAFSYSVSVPLPSEAERLAQFQRHGVLFLLSSVVPELVEKVQDADAEIVLDSEKLPDNALTAILSARESNGVFNHINFRNAFSKAYLERRNLQHENFKIPDRLENFPSFKNWEKEVITYSRVKGQTRVVYKSPVGFVPSIRVAETLNTEDGNTEASVRETEMLIQRSRDSKNWDFYAFDASGALSEESHFRPGMRPSPGICMSCHYSELDKSFRPIMNF